MDPRRFDSLTKALSTAGSRRRVLAGVLGSLRLRTTIADDSGTVIADTSGGDHNQATATDPAPGGHDHNHDNDHNDHDKDHDKDKDKDKDRDQTCDATICATGCCDGTTCQTGQYATCGTGGGACVNCDAAIAGCTSAVCECRAGRGCCVQSGEEPAFLDLECTACCSGDCTQPGN